MFHLTFTLDSDTGPQPFLVFRGAESLLGPSDMEVNQEQEALDAP